MSKGVCIETFIHLMMVSLGPKQIICKNLQTAVEMAFPMLIDFWFPISPVLTAKNSVAWSVAGLLHAFEQRGVGKVYPWSTFVVCQHERMCKESFRALQLGWDM